MNDDHLINLLYSYIFYEENRLFNLKEAAYRLLLSDPYDVNLFYNYITLLHQIEYFKFFSSKIVDILRRL